MCMSIAYFPSEKTLVEMGVTLKNENEDKIRETGVAHTGK